MIRADLHCRPSTEVRVAKPLATTGYPTIDYWSGGNTTLEGLQHDLPIITIAVPLMRGRHTTGILREMGIEETIAGSALTADVSR